LSITAPKLEVSRTTATPAETPAWTDCWRPELELSLKVLTVVVSPLTVIFVALPSGSVICRNVAYGVPPDCMWLMYLSSEPTAGVCASIAFVVAAAVLLTVAMFG
jgi:hypothetical protein